jgi:FkbM family methyltransferase
MIEAETRASPPAAPRLKRLRTTIGVFASGLGVAPQPKPSPPAAEMSGALANLFTTLAIDLVIDVGAGTGTFGTLIRAAGYTGPIASFEPIPSLFAALDALTASDDRWTASPVAIGATPGTLPLNVVDLGNAPVQRATITRRNVAMHRLDQIIPPLRARHDARRLFLNIDAPMRERDILAGAEQTIGRIAAVQTRLSTTLHSDGMPHYLAILSMFEARHFSPHRFFPLSEDLPGPTDFAACLVRQAATDPTG